MSSIGGGGGGFGGIVNGILGMFGGGGGGFSSGDFANLAASFIDSAKGNVFSGSPSLHAYANTVQTSPKTFAFQNLHGFAKGGIFAEAGPEAVMPLKRDSYGRLGVQAEGGDGKVINITVNVNGTNAPDVRRAAGQGAREALSALNGARRYG
jgi:lambda family phage tail tape measure protein